MSEKSYRIESDSLGQIEVPVDALWGAQTQRAIENFAISGDRFPREFIEALGFIKRYAAEVNQSLGLLEPEVARVIAGAAGEVAAGKWDEHFVVDIYQTGSGTSTNMNANEVIANRAAQMLKKPAAGSSPVHPNDHVNRGQSSNDVIPTAIHIAVLLLLHRNLVPALEELRRTINTKAEEFHHVIKTGRTHLQDATPVRLGQVFSGYASILEHAVERIQRVEPEIAELALGGTAVGTGVNTHPKFAALVIQRIAEETGLPFREARNHFEAQGGRDALVSISGVMKTLAVGLTKIANDIRWLGSGPRNGIGELIIPAVQPGSSIMPGKVNPVIAEALLQVCAQVIGNDTVVALGGQSGNFELNVMMPVMAHNVIRSIRLLAKAVAIFDRKCLSGLQADEIRCAEMVELSLALATPLALRLGYDRAAEIAKQAYEQGKSIREVVLDAGLMNEAEVSDLLDHRKLVD